MGYINFNYRMMRQFAIVSALLAWLATPDAGGIVSADSSKQITYPTQFELDDDTNLGSYYRSSRRRSRSSGRWGRHTRSRRYVHKSMSHDLGYSNYGRHYDYNSYSDYYGFKKCQKKTDYMYGYGYYWNE